MFRNCDAIIEKHCHIPGDNGAYIAGAHVGTGMNLGGKPAGGADYGGDNQLQNRSQQQD